jgi:hypothetical protein
MCHRSPLGSRYNGADRQNYTHGDDEGQGSDMDMMEGEGFTIVYICKHDDLLRATRHTIKDL